MDDIKINRVAVIYARYSSDRQNEQSIEGQVRVISEYAARNNIRIIKSYIDRAMTGRSDDRPEFQQMIKDAKSGTFDTVLVYKFDRFSRDRLNSLIYKRELKKCGVKVVSATEYISDDPQGILLESIIDGYSEFYSAELAEKVKRGNKESRLKGQFTGGQCIYGYKIENKKYVIVPEEANVIKEIFKRVNNKETMTEICADLNSRGIRHHGEEFRVGYVSKVIRNPKYIGKCIIKGETFDNIVPPILDEETFNMACNNTINNKRRSGHYKTKIDFYLADKVYCGYCGEVLYGETGTSANGEVYGYYKCKTKKNRLGHCDKKPIRKDALENYVVDFIKTAIIETDSIDKYAERLCTTFNNKNTDDSLLKLNESALKQNKKEIDNIINAIMSGIINDSLKNKLSELEEERNNLEIENLKLKTKTKDKLVLEDVIGFLESILCMDTSSPENKKRLIDRFVRRVDLFNDRILISLYPIDDVFIREDINKSGNGGNNSSSNDVNKANNGGNCINCSNLLPSGPPYSQKPNP